MAIAVCVFDAYGTLFDVSAAAREAAAEPGREVFAERWQSLAALWRDKQIGYTWLRTAAGVHTDFWQVTQDALDHALETLGLDEPELRTRLLQLYWELGAFPEVGDMLDRLAAAGQRSAILSNGSPAMLAAAVDSAGLGSRLDAVLSAESVGRFKPAREVYDLVGRAYGVAAREVLFVSSNGWDAWAATAYGFRSVWVNRAGAPGERLTVPPERVVPDLGSIPEIAAAL